MIQQLISRKISALIDWAASFMGQVYPKHQEDHQTIALFKNILMTIDSVWFKELLSQPYSIRQLEIKINQYFKEKYEQVKETVLQGGTKQNNDIRILAMFQLLLELSYISTKQQCLTAISQLEQQAKNIINKILQDIIKQRGNKESTPRQISSQDSTIRRLKQQNKRLKGALQALRINQQSLIQQNLELEKRIRELQYQYLKKQSEIDQSNRKICQLQNILKQISMQVFNEDIQQNSVSKQNSQNQDVNPMINIKFVNSIEYQKQNPKFPTILQNINEEQSKQGVTNNADKSFEQDQKVNDGWYMKKLERQYRKSQQINHRFHLLRQMHLKLQREVENILIN